MIRLCKHIADLFGSGIEESVNVCRQWLSIHLHAGTALLHFHVNIRLLKNKKALLSRGRIWLLENLQHQNELINFEEASEILAIYIEIHLCFTIYWYHLS